VHRKSIICNKPTRRNSGGIVFIKNYKYALHVSDALCVHLQEHLHDPLHEPLHEVTKLIPYEQLFIQTFHHNGDLIDEQSATEHNPLFHLVKCT